MATERKMFRLPVEGTVAHVYEPLKDSPELQLIRFDFVDDEDDLSVDSVPVFSQAKAGKFEKGQVVDLSKYTVIEKVGGQDANRKARLYLIPKSKVAK